jgi:transketolase
MPRTVEELAEIARGVRIDTVKELYVAQSGHPGSSLSAMDVMVACYFGGFLAYDPLKPDWSDRDIFILSVGHAVPGLYSCLAHAGYAPLSELNGLRKLGTRLQGHAKAKTFPGVEVSAGSLGQGLNVGVGQALGLRLQSLTNKVVVLMSDGEQEEGSVYEAAMCASKYNLSNLIAIVDKNGNQINGPTAHIMPSLDPLAPKYEAFGWATRTINGNDMGQVVDGLTWATEQKRPSVIISETQTGHPLSFMVGDYHWHHGVIKPDLFRLAMSELGEHVSSTPDESWLPGVSEAGRSVNA